LQVDSAIISSIIALIAATIGTAAMLWVTRRASKDKVTKDELKRDDRTRLGLIEAAQESLKDALNRAERENRVLRRELKDCKAISANQAIRIQALERINNGPRD